MKRGTIVCILGTLAFISTIHVFEAFVAVFFNAEVILLKLYPFINSMNIESLNYLIGSLIITSSLIAITFRFAFSSPLENYLNMILSDANLARENECELVTDNRSILDMMCESITNISNVLGQTKDITYNVRSELVNLRPVPEKAERLSIEIKEVKKEIVKLKENFKKQKSCPSCGNTVLTKFKICPYCGEALQLSPEKIIVKKYNKNKENLFKNPTNDTIN
jgi:hypothetical protein